eukprot:tig00001669_g9560.t1
MPYPDRHSGPPKVYYLGTVKTCERFPLVVATERRVPYLLNRPGEGKFLTGELYAVDDEELKRLDVFEGCPDYYTRITIPIRPKPEEIRYGTDRSIFPMSLNWEGSTLTAGAYVRLTFPPELLELPHLEEYTDEFAREYVPRNKRGTGASQLQIERTLEIAKRTAALALDSEEGPEGKPRACAGEEQDLLILEACRAQEQAILS